MCDMEVKLHPLVKWQEAYGHVEEAARKVLDGLDHGTTLTTVGLAAALYSGPLQPIKKRLFKALDALATHGLAGYVTPGPVVEVGPLKGRHLRLWGKTNGATIAPVRSCPTCKRPYA